MTTTHSLHGRNRTAAAVLLAWVVAACGTTTATLPPAPSPISVAPAATPTPSPTATPVMSIVPVPTTQLVAPDMPSIALDQATAAALQKALSAARAARNLPGVSAAVVFPNGTVWAGQSGSAVLSPKKAVTADTLFSIASISKTFVSALVGRLASRGVLSFDDPLAKYVPTFPNAANITLFELLNHTSGIRDLFEVMDKPILADPARAWTLAEVLAKVGRGRYFAPGKGYHYSNTNYVLLGAVVEKVTGQPIASLIRTEFLEPLGLTHTFLQTEEDAPGPKAHGYMGTASAPKDNSAGTMLPFTAEATAAGSAGAFVSTPTDVARWANALYSGKILDEATLASMVDVSRTKVYRPRWVYGLGMEETTLAGQLAWGHRGHLDGFWSAVWYLPASKVTIMVTSNGEWADPVAATAALAAVLIPKA